MFTANRELHGYTWNVLETSIRYSPLRIGISAPVCLDQFIPSKTEGTTSLVLSHHSRTLVQMRAMEGMRHAEIISLPVLITSADFDEGHKQTTHSADTA